MGLKRRWQDALAANPREAATRPIGWGQAMAAMAGVTAVLWIVQVVNALDGQRLDRFGLRARTVHGLYGIVTMPFLHAGWEHLLANTGPFLLIGWVVMIGGPKVWGLVTVLCVALGGALTWLIGPSDTVLVGSSGLIMAWLGYLIARAVFSRRFVWITVAVVVALLFGGLFGNLLPTMSGPGNATASWQAHVAGFVAGVAVGWLLHPRKATQAALRFRTPAR